MTRAAINYCTGIRDYLAIDCDGGRKGNTVGFASKKFKGRE